MYCISIKDGVSISVLAFTIHAMFHGKRRSDPIIHYLRHNFDKGQIVIIKMFVVLSEGVTENIPTTELMGKDRHYSFQASSIIGTYIVTHAGSPIPQSTLSILV